MLAYVDISEHAALGGCISAAVQGGGNAYGPIVYTFETTIG